MANQSKKTVCLFHCDKTYNLGIVEAFLEEMNEKYGLEFVIQKHEFRLFQMADVCETIIPQLQMDCAIFVVQANESRLSINEDNAGIGYSEIYRALLKATDNQVLIVIGGDDNYASEDEEERVVISRWARRKVASQFEDEYLDGRKSFIFSWNKRHREIHEEALLHYFDPSKNGIKFEYPPKQNPDNYHGATCEHDKKTRLRNENKEQEEPMNSEIKGVVERPQYEGNRDKTGRTETNKLRSSQGQINYGGTVLLETRLLHGEISYRKWHIVKRKDQWKPSETHTSDLRAKQFIEHSSVQFFSTGNGGIDYTLLPTTRLRRCIDCFRMCCCYACFYDD
ncbi:uncharacterized protein LOC111343201 isoform X3 [Stylophora pistillata]|uniref:uncharacterized protein LOC111343201 isoform X3 n=1 Tax=Stylophora pistillata TaxID=50429 RepID=UPI000C04D407|nr:uncharacterized protein LOC111343201 isoform X3 [Stylophora pistillata]